MEKRFTLLKLSICVLAMLTTTLIPLLVQPSYAAGHSLNDDVELLATGWGKAILYWEEENPTNLQVWYQFSSDRLKTWSPPQMLASFDDREEFDGIEIGCGLLVASFAVQEGNDAVVYVYKSTDRGKTWSNRIEAGRFPNSTFNECPALNAQYDFKLGRFSLVSVILSSSDGSANVYLLTSKYGINWDKSPALGGDAFPPNCEE